MRETSLSKKFSLKLPLFIAPMSGGPSTPALVAESCEAGALGSLGSILPFPAQNSFTRDIRNKAAEMGISDFLSLWAGEGVNSIQANQSARDLIQSLIEELE